MEVEGLRTINEDYDQTARIIKLIWVFAGRTSLILGFVERWLISIYVFLW